MSTAAPAAASPPKAPQKSPASAGTSPAVRPASASPKKALGPKSIASKSPATPSTAAAAAGASPVKRVMSPAGAAKAPAAAGTKKVLVASKTPPAAGSGLPAAAAAPFSAGAATAPTTTTGKKLFKRPVAAATTTATPAAAAPVASAPASGGQPAAQTPSAATETASSTPLAATPHQASTPMNASLVVSPVTATAPQQQAMPLDQVIARNQEAAAALAILVSRQTEQDREKLSVANEKIEALQKLLVEREAENKSKIDSLEKQLAILVTTHASTRRENELLKDVLADRDGPKLVQRLELLEEENRKLKIEAAKAGEMADYHRQQQLKAMEDVEKLKEGLPIGPTQTEMDAAHESISKLSKENTNLILKSGEVENRLNAMVSQKDLLLEQQSELQELVRLKQEQIEQLQQLRRESSPGGNAMSVFGGGAGSRQGSQPPQQHNSPQNQLRPNYGNNSTFPDPYRGLSQPPRSASINIHRSGSNDNGGYDGGLISSSYGVSAASPSPFVNNSKFNGFSGAGASLRGVSTYGSFNNGGGGGTRGWRALMLPNGNVIYHNMISNRSQWEVPAELSGNMTEVSATVAAEDSHREGSSFQQPNPEGLTALKSAMSVMGGGAGGRPMIRGFL